jgi:ABC-2 type transport system permease protein
LISIGLFTSALTQSQVIAGITGFGISLFFLLVNSLAQTSIPWLNQIMQELSLLSKYIDFHKGILDTQHLIYYVLWMTLSILLANKAVESRLWN